MATEHQESNPIKKLLSFLSKEVHGVKKVDDVFLMDGENKLWYENGCLNESCSYVNGKKHGQYKSWYENGNIKQSFEYVNEVIHGEYKSWHSNGFQDEISYYVNGRIHGIRKVLLIQDGVTEECEYVDGKRHGSCISYYNNGQMKNKYEYDNEKIVGAYSSWYINGSKRNESNYVNGHLDGKYLTFHWSGYPFEEYVYEQDKVIKVMSIKDTLGRETALDTDSIVTVWKACKANQNINVYVKLLLDKDTLRVTPKMTDCARYQCTYKSRVSCARVLEIIDERGHNYTECESFVHTGTKLKYIVGELVIPDGFNNDLNEECGQGINVHVYKDHCDLWFRKIVSVS